MLKRVQNTTIGDIFCAKINESQKKYFQYIISDLAQLNSDVIRAFKAVYPLDTNPNLSEIISGEIEFYAHCVTKAGIKIGLWEKIGNIQTVGDIEHILFKCKGDYKDLNKNDWWIWKINQNIVKVGKLNDKQKQAEYGLVFTPNDILDRLKTGKYIGLE
jgi:hypothetical protein